MMKPIMKLFLLLLLPCIAVDAVAQETEENSRSEFIFCKLNDGFTFDDVKARAAEYEEKLKADGTQYNQYLMRPLFTGDRMEGYTHILVGVWPNGDQMYKEYGKYVNEYMDQRSEDAPATCNMTVATMDMRITYDYRDGETSDERFPVQVSDCNLNEGVNMDLAVEMSRETNMAASDNDMGGYGVHWLDPYLGFQDYEHDFISLVWWQSFEHRANMAQNWYKVAEAMGPKVGSTVRCEEPRAYFAENIISTW